MSRKCLACDADAHKPHMPGCEVLAEEQAEPAPPQLTVNAAQYLMQARAAERWMHETLAAARAAGHEVIGDMIIVR